MRYQRILSLVATLAVAAADAGECVTTLDQYVSVLRTQEGPGQTGTRSSTTTSDSGKTCMTYAEVQAQDPSDGLMDRLFTPLNKEINKDTCQQMENSLGEGKFQCVVSVSQGTSDLCKKEFGCEDQVQAEVGFCDPGPACGNAAYPDDPCNVAKDYTTAAYKCFPSCTDDQLLVKMPVYQGVPLSEQSVELQSTKTFKDCEAAASGEDNILQQMMNISKCLSNACKSSK